MRAFEISRGVEGDNQPQGSASDQWTDE